MKNLEMTMCASCHFDTTGSMSLQRNSALSMRTICFSKSVSELVIQTGLTRPQSWTEEVSDLGRPLPAGNCIQRSLKNKLVNTNTGQIKAAKFNYYRICLLSMLLTNEMFMQIYICSVIPQHLLPSLLPL